MKKKVEDLIKELNKKYKLELELTSERFWCRREGTKYCILDVDKKHGGIYTKVMFGADTLRLVYDQLLRIENFL